MSSVDLGSAQTNILSALLEIYTEDESPVKGETIANMIDRNPGTIRNQMQSLKSLQLVEGVPGPKGGYRPTKKAYKALDQPNSTSVSPEKIELLETLEDKAERLQNKISKIEQHHAEEEPKRGKAVSQPSIEIDILSTDRSLIDVVEVESYNKILLSDPKSVRDLVEKIDKSEVEEIEVQIDASTVEKVTNQFPLNSVIKNLIEEEKIELYQSARDDQFESVLLTDTNSFLSIKLFGVNILFKIGEQNVSQKLRHEFDSTKEDGVEIKVESWSVLLSQLGSATNQKAVNEFRKLARGSGTNLEPINEVETAIISGARAEVLFSKISKWGEETNIASKATFSRTKSKLEENGEIETEKVPIEVGRSKLRLISSEV